MNMGGPAHHVSLLSGLLDPERFETLLVTGEVGPGEASLTDLAERYGTTPLVVPTLGPELRPGADAKTLRALGRIVRGFSPDIVHTHTAKAGMLGRLAARLGGGSRPIVVHTYHGHVLEGYFGPAKTRLYRTLETVAARSSDCLIGVSEATVDDLVRLGVAPREKFRVVPLGLPLEPFLALGRSADNGVREETGATPGDVVFTYVGRLVPIKRVDLALRALAEARALGAPARLVIVGDGPLRRDLEQLAGELGVSPYVRFLGYRRDLESIAAATDVGLLCSASEGTPVSLIELAAGGRPLLATDAGGVREVVAEGTGVVVPPRDHRALASAIVRLAADEDLRARLGTNAREHVRARFGAQRLVRDIEELYDELSRRARP
jgi:glycosyltransferase involved in cell wall biosynthesis